MHGAFLKMFVIIAILALGSLFLFWSGLLPSNVYPPIYQFTDNLPLGTRASVPYLEKYEGHWTFAFTTTTPTTSYGDCPAFSTIASAHNGAFSAHISIPGYVTVLSGTAATTGVISGQLASGNDQYLGTFSGTIQGTTGFGTWSDNLECRGTWTLTKSAMSVDPVQAIISSLTGRVELIRTTSTSEALPRENLYTGDQLQVPSDGQAHIVLGIAQKIVDIVSGTTYTVPDVGGMTAQ